MINNDVLRSVRYMLDLSDAKVARIIALGGYEIEQAEIAGYLKKEDEEGHVPVPDKVMAHFLDGLVFHLRGKDESLPPRPVEKRVSNNTVLKKLRVAFELKESDLHAIMQAAGFAVSKPELNALFRKSDHSNYRACGDQFLRNFLKGLTLRVRGTP
jgi:uncharacterized protein YehS (DUF1456 family)